MREADETIQRLMAGLRDAEPSPGMERRILEAMEAHHATPSPWLSHRSVAASLVCATALAASLIVATRVNQRSHAPAAGHSTHAEAGQRAQPEAVAHKAPMEPRQTASRVSARRARAGDVPETQAASYPAPPLALTEQEKLLLRIAHRNDAESKALLNPDLQATQSGKAAQQFQQFFGIDAEEMRNESE